MTTSRALYEHRQLGWTMMAVAALPAICLLAFLAVTPAANRELPMPLIPGLGIASLVVLVGFSSLSVVVTTTHVVLRFGIGLYRRVIPLETIVSVATTTTRWYEGWGVHFTRQGMLYNVQGFDAVRVELANGKRLRIGSDDATRLRSAIQRAMDTYAKNGAARSR
jgi:hypothetical protein